jgi:hypothetical protein
MARCAEEALRAVAEVKPQAEAATLLLKADRVESRLQRSRECSSLPGSVHWMRSKSENSELAGMADRVRMADTELGEGTADTRERAATALTYSSDDAGASCHPCSTSNGES